MTDHITKDWFDDKVRQTEDGKASVLDLIRNAITGRGERVVWHRLKAENPELEQLVDTVSFPDGMGRTGKNTLTPVVDLKGWLEILALLPGAAGKKYRKAAADLVVRVWRGDADLGLAIMLRDADKSRLERAKARMRVGDYNKSVTASAMENGERPDHVHDARYRGLYRRHTGQVRKEMGLTKSECPLDFMGSGDLAMHEVVQHLALRAVENKGGSLQGYVYQAAEKMRKQYESVVGTEPPLPKAAQIGAMDLKDARAITANSVLKQGSFFS